MTGNLRMLLTLLATFVVSAAMAPAASGDAFDFYAEEEEIAFVALSDGAVDRFTADAGIVDCTEGLFGGTFATEKKVNTTAIIIPTIYVECSVFDIGLKAEIDFNGCFFVPHVGTHEGGKYEGTVSILCKQKDERIAVTAPGCTVKISPQNNLKTITYTNIGEDDESEITADINLTGVKYEEHNKGIFPTCADNTKAKSNGTIEAQIRVAGKKNEEQVGVWVEKT